MGNCQAVDAATLVIQYPCGKVDKLYWPVNAGELMKTNPGHYVALLLSTTLYPANNNAQCPNKATPNAVTTSSGASTTTTTTTITNNNSSLRITRIKLLRPTDTLVLGHVYRLIKSEEVMKGLWAKKQAKHKKNLQYSESSQKPERIREINQVPGLVLEVKRSELEKNYQVSKNERNRPRTASATNSASNTVRSRTWQPSLNSILEAGS
ncbi:uncharacterized protein LOC8258109 [Ricinus communis]|uniref:Uncharacterized protein n=1 Tax=Ricinus communis TaxID=3988 RepID=B9RB74_RICCO|nr:uncharacterized protein LOC8258109 [Ricinus communis]EEF52051.1 conserved hypothetical protein [Ricinus communis]|eukprot:XP_002511449.1 uncharacterized protein LOC8258109 [Ricinus communis]